MRVSNVVGIWAILGLISAMILYWYVWIPPLLLFLIFCAITADYSGTKSDKLKSVSKTEHKAWKSMSKDARREEWLNRADSRRQQQ